VLIDLHIANHTLGVGAYSARIVYDPTILRAISVACFGRGCVLEATSGDTSDVGILVILAFTFDVPEVFIPRGSGVVAQMKFFVRQSALPGAITTLSLVDDIEPPIEGVNALTDSAGTELVHPRLVDGNFSVTGGGFNQPPVIGNISTQQVAEGQVLQFGVSAHDPNGDPITLSAQNLPANSTFPTVQADSAVSGVFTFAPTFEQGPDTFYVDFVAVDDHNNTNRMTVPIIVLDQPNDMLIIDSGQGGVPGATGRDLSVDLFNSNAIFGLQFKYFYDQSQIQVIDVIPTERCLGLSFWYSTPSPGEIIVLIFSGGLDPIEEGSGPLVRFVTDVGSSAVFGRTAVVLDSAVEVIDSIGTSRLLVTENGYFTVDRFGDANLDEFVNVGDCVTIVAFIIERIMLDIRQFDAADINRDGRVNVGDLQNVIDRILQIPLGPGPSPQLFPVVVQLSDDPEQSGDLMTIGLVADITTEAAAVQYSLSYNADHLEPVDVAAGDIVSSLRFDNNIAEGKISGVFYDLTGATFGPASGELATFTFRMKNGRFNPRDLAITDFMIVDRGAALIPSEIKGLLPTQYILNQNYPNPFNASTNISFDLPYDSDAELMVYDVLGRKIATLHNGYLLAGNHIFTWNGRSEKGEAMATGIFFYRLRSADFDETKKMILVK
jgi:hypothetical protein